MRVVSFMVAYLVFHPFIKLFHENLWVDKVKFAVNIELSQYKPRWKGIHKDLPATLLTCILSCPA